MGSDSELVGSHGDNSRGMVITFRPGSPYDGNLYYYSGQSDQEGNPIYKPYEGSLYSSRGHLTVRYIAGEQISDDDTTRILTYVPGRKASLKGDYDTWYKQ